MAKKKKEEKRKLGAEALLYEQQLDQIRAQEQAKEAKEKEHWFVHFCKWAYRKLPDLGKGAKMNEEYRKNVEFLGWDISAEELAAGPKFALVISLFVVIFGFFIVFFILPIDFMIKIYAVSGMIIVPFFLVFYLQGMPMREAQTLRVISMTYIPEIINYLVMSMKLTPQLEKAVDFAAQHGRGKIARDLRECLWQTEVGIYKTIEDALDNLAYRWGDFSEVFKHAMMLVRSSVLEPDDMKRATILDKASSNVLEGIKEEMDIYVRGMQQPSVYLYYFGVMLPLMLVIVIPIGAMMSCTPLAQWPILMAMYNFGIPAFAFIYARSIISKRPPTYIPPNIPDNYPGLPKKGSMKVGSANIPIKALAFIAFAAALTAGYTANLLFIDSIPDWKNVDRTPYYTIFGILAGTAFAISVYFAGISIYKRRIQKEMMSMEQEFQDAIYVLASRLGENRPIEEAFQYTIDFLPQLKITETVFQKAMDNVTSMGMTLDTALFHPTYGALRYVPSHLIRGSMRIIVDSVSLGSQLAAKSLISLSAQLRDQQKMDETLRRLLGDVTSMMRSMSLFITPLVLGITSALEKIVISALGSISTGSLTTLPSGGGNLPGASGAGLGFGGMESFLGCPEILKGALDPTSFLLIIGFFVLEVVIVLLWFVARIEEGENELAFPSVVFKVLPIAIVLFCASVLGSNQMIGGYSGL